MIRKGYCSGCPFNWGEPSTEAAFNLGCLPGEGEINALCDVSETAWACHSEPEKTCCGHAARHGLPLQIVEGIHAQPASGDQP